MFLGVFCYLLVQTVLVLNLHATNIEANLLMHDCTLQENNMDTNYGNDVNGKKLPSTDECSKTFEIHELKNEIEEVKYMCSKMREQNEILLQSKISQQKEIETLMHHVNNLMELVKETNKTIREINEKVHRIEHHVTSGPLVETVPPKVEKEAVLVNVTRKPSNNVDVDSQCKEPSSPAPIVNKDLKEEAIYTGNLVEVFNQVCANLKLDQDERKKRNKELHLLVRDWLINGLKKDDLFDKLFQDIGGTGSFYEGLKVSNPDEFDLNLIMRLPHMPNKSSVKDNEPSIEVTDKDAPPGYIFVHNLGAVLDYIKTNSYTDYATFKPMQDWINEEGSLLQSKFRSWIEGLITKFMNQNRNDIIKKMDLTHFRFRKSGPAMTLEINSVSIDLVPVLEVRPDDDVVLQHYRTLPADPPMPWYLVPKLASDGDDRGWRFSCYRHERRMIENLKNLKPAIKIAKKLRDTKQWKLLASYYIKCAAFLEIEEKNMKWDNTIDQVAIQFLKQLQKRIEDNTIFHYWDRRYNMLDGMSEVTRNNIAQGFKRVLTKMDLAIEKKNYAEIAMAIAPFKEKSSL